MTRCVTKKGEREAGLALARYHAWALLARVYASEPTPALAQALAAPAAAGALAGLAGVEAPRWQVTPAWLDEIVVDYTVLFLGPGPHLSPHESVNRPDTPGGGLLWGKVTTEVAAFMREAGLAVPDDAGMIPDHIAVEFQFLARLSQAEGEAWLDQDTKRARCCQEWQERFMREHISAWVPAFAACVAANARTDFWRLVGRATQAAVRACDAPLGGRPRKRGNPAPPGSRSAPAQAGGGRE